ncbi:MAG: hypothetical protein WC781_05235 [Candidatus Pacearchaeota archaeon]|jgi:hypothetical protein
MVSLNKLLYSKKIQLGIFLAMLMLSVSFLFKKGVWIYLDAFFWPVNQFEVKKFLFDEVFNIFNIMGGYFGSGAEIFSPFRYLIHSIIYLITLIFGVEFGQLILTLLFFILNFLFSYLFFRNIYVGKNNFYLSLFVTFNPIALFLATHMGIMFLYTGMPILLYSCTLIYKRSFLPGFLFFAIGSNFICIYPRLILSNLIFLFILVIYMIFINNNRKEFIEFFKVNFNPLLCGVLFIILVNSPTLLIVEKIIFEEDNITNYLSNNNNFVGWLSLDKNDASQLFIFNNITAFPDIFSSKFSILLGFLILIILLYSLFNHKWEKDNIFTKKDFLFFISMFLIALFLQIYVFLDRDLNRLLFFYNTLFSFMSGVIRYGTILVLFLFIPLIILFYKTFNNKLKIIFNIILIIYLIIPMVFIIYEPNKFQRINPDILNELGVINSETNLSLTSTIYLPYDVISYENYPYPLEIWFLIKDKPQFLSNNVRLTDPTEGNLKSNWINYKNNLFILNTKEVYLAKAINLKEYFPYMPNIDYNGLYNQFKKQLDTAGFDVKFENDKFILYSLEESNNYEFLIYSPRIINDEKEFYNSNLNKFEIPVLINKSKYNLSVEGYQNKLNLSFKYSFFDPTRYYVKISDIDTSKPLIIQLNKAYSSNWKIKEINDKLFNEKSCESDLHYYNITKNSYCFINSVFLEPSDIKLLKDKSIESNHFVGNFIGNTWIISSEELSNKNELYLEIVYERQIYYHILLIIAFFSLLFISSLILYKFLIKSKRSN